MNTLIVGASAGLGRSLAQQWAAHGHPLVLVASDLRDLEALASDLRLRHQCRVGIVPIDLEKLEVDALRAACASTFGRVDAVLIPAGYGEPEYDSAPVSDAFARRILRVNFEAAIRIVNGFLPELIDRDGTVVAGFGSVAAAAPRSRNRIYASAKRGLEFYFATLESYLHRRHPRVLFYRLGYMRTSLTFGERYRLPVADPDAIAASILRDCLAKRGFKWLPSWWRWVMLVYACIPPTVRNALERSGSKT